MPGPEPQAIQVLVYSGPGVSPLSLSHTLLSLSLLLLPNYTVQPVSTELLATEPWEPNCALLVIPGGRDLPYIHELSVKNKVTARIAEFVREGGRYLGICAGGYFASSEVKFDVGGPKEVTGKRELAFFPGACAGPTFSGFDYGSEKGARAVTVHTKDSALDLIYYNGGGHYILPDPLPSNVEVLARYAEPPSPEANVAMVQMTIGKGKALLSSIHPEYPLEDPPARDAIAKLSQEPPREHVEESEKARVEWLCDLLSGLGLRLPGHKSNVADDAPHGEEDPHLLLHPTHPSPVFVLSHPKLPQLAEKALAADKIQSKLQDVDGWKRLRDGNDEIDLGSVDLAGDVPAYLAKRRREQPEFPPTLEELAISDSVPPAKAPDLHSLRKTLLTPGTKPYSAAWTPLFNFDTYWAELDHARKEDGRRTGVMRADELSPGRKGERPTIGDLLFYGESVTSTQTMLDRNPILLANLPSPLTFLASFQLSGRGRGSNVWLSPPGCLQFSILLTLPQAMASKMIQIQYLAALAISEALDPDGRLGVRIKWPNDLYAEVEGVGGTEVGGGKKGRAKIGGILVNTNFINGQWRIIVGCGINILNALPTSSVSQLHNLLTEREATTGNKGTPVPPPSMEGSFARIMHAFELKWAQFLNAGSFSPFLDEYHARWLHSGQEVTLTTVEPHQKLKVVGITPDQGLLRCVPITPAKRGGLTPLYDRGGYGESETEYVDLQPDGNSFDLMSGMIKKKV